MAEGQGQISNKTLFVRCPVENLSERVEKKWNTFVKKSWEPSYPIGVLFVVDFNELYEGRLRRPRMNIFSILVNDLREKNLSMYEQFYYR